jgi:hypothetical protein
MEGSEQIPASIEIEKDRMSAHLSIKPAVEAGRHIEEAELRKIIADAGVVYGLLEEEIARAVAEQSAEQLLIAAGTPPEDGEDGYLEFLISKTHLLDAAAIDDEHEIVDLHDVGSLFTVAAGQPLVRRHPPTPGTPGRNVLGEEIPSRPGKDTIFGRGLEGAVVADDNPDLLVSAFGGLPVFKPDGISVTKVLTVEQVDMSVGNLDFDGSINVTGNIHSDMHVHATGDILVGGMIEAATVNSDSNITVKGGIIGRGTSVQHGVKSEEVAQVHANGELTALFLENAVVSANSISVLNNIIQSQVTAATQVIVGGEKSDKSAIRGGTIRAGMLIRTPVLGARTSNQTVMIVGVDPMLIDQIGVIRKIVESKGEEQDQLNRVIKLLTGLPSKLAMLEKAQKSLVSVEEELRLRNEELQTLEAKIESGRHAKVEVTHSIDGVARITIGRRSVTILEPRERGTFFLSIEKDEEKIRYEQLGPADPN